jgi:hypothetical protein
LTTPLEQLVWLSLLGLVQEVKDLVVRRVLQGGIRCPLLLQDRKRVSLQATDDKTEHGAYHGFAPDTEVSVAHWLVNGAIFAFVAPGMAAVRAEMMLLQVGDVLRDDLLLLGNLPDFWFLEMRWVSKNRGESYHTDTRGHLLFPLLCSILVFFIVLGIGGLVGRLLETNQ